MGINREKFNMAIAILEKWIFDSTIIISHFGGTNDILDDYTTGCPLRYVIK